MRAKLFVSYWYRIYDYRLGFLAEVVWKMPPRRKLPTPGQTPKKNAPRTNSSSNCNNSDTQPDESVSPSTSSQGNNSDNENTTGIADQPKSHITSSDNRVVELETQLEVSRSAQDSLLERALRAEKRVEDLEAIQKELDTLTKSNDASQSEMIAALKVEVEGKQGDLERSNDEITELNIKLSKMKQELEEMEDLKDQLKVKNKLCEDQAEELGSLSGELEAAITRMAEKESAWNELSGIHESQMSVLQSQLANVKGELMSLKSFSADQNRFIDNLGEENSKLVAEIQRLKEQAKVRDKQLQESVLLARDAILREKKKRADWERRNSSNR